MIEQGEKLKFFEYLTYYLKEKKMTSMLWDNGQHFNRKTYKWSDSELQGVLMSGLKERSSSTESDLVYLKKGAAIKDTKVKLNLNGNKLTTISVNGKYLTKGKDYTLNGEELTIKASQLKSSQLPKNTVKMLC